MVSAAPTAHAGEAQADEYWLRQIARWLHLGRDKVVILIEGASPGGLRPLMRSLLAVEPSPRVCFHAPELLDVPQGELVVLQVQTSELRWLNLNRPLLHNRRLRLLLWLGFPLHELRNGAPDFFDWISHVVRCPDAPPSFAGRGLRAALAAGRPLAWRGLGLDAAARVAEIELARVAAGGRFDALVSALSELDGQVPVLTGVGDLRRMLRIELATRQAHQPFAIVERPDDRLSQWMEFEGDSLPWSVAVSRAQQGILHVERSVLAQLAALVECESAAVDLLIQASRAGIAVEDSLKCVLDGDDAGTAIADLIMGRARDVEIPGSIAIRLGHESGRTPMANVLARRHADAVASDRVAAWVRAADCARIAGHPDVALACCRRAVRRAVGERAQRRVAVALAAANHACGLHDEAHRLFDEGLEVLEGTAPRSPLLGLLLTEQAAMLSDEGQHEDAAMSSHQAIEIWEHNGRGLLVRLHLEALRLHGRSLVANGDLSAHAAFVVRSSESWPRTKEGQVFLQIERARGGDHDARHTLWRQLSVWRGPSLVIPSLELAELMVSAGENEKAVEVCLRVLDLLRARFGTDIHPYGVDARMLAARCLDSASEDARSHLRKALEVCGEVYGDVPHRRTLRVMLQLAELVRRQGNLASALSLVERAGRLANAIT